MSNVKTIILTGTETEVRFGSNIDFKAIAIFKNISQGRGLILENIAFLKDKFQIN